VSDIRTVNLHLQKYSLSFDTEGCGHYAEGGARKRADPVKQVNVDKDSVMFFAPCCTVIQHKPTKCTFLN